MRCPTNIPNDFGEQPSKGFLSPHIEVKAARGMPWNGPDARRFYCELKACNFCANISAPAILHRLYIFDLRHFGCVEVDPFVVDVMCLFSSKRAQESLLVYRNSVSGKFLDIISPYQSAVCF